MSRKTGARDLPTTLAPSPVIRKTPVLGIPAVVNSLEGLATVARQIASYSGPVAIDTERASAFRYDDRAFLIQLKRDDSPVFLVAPEGLRTETQKYLAPVLNEADWVLHAAASDLPSLSMLGLHPRNLFDTEIAARLLGFSHPNLSAMTEHFLGFRLAKGQSADDWSATPLTTSQRSYAALDVESLLDLAHQLEHALATANKSAWQTQECAEIVRRFSTLPQFPQRDWSGMKGINRITSRRKLAAARDMWKLREQLAQRRDVAPGKLLSNKALLDLANALPSSISAAKRLPALRSSRPQMLGQFLAAAHAAAQAPPSTDLELDRKRTTIPSAQQLRKDYPELAKVLEHIRIGLAERAESLAVQRDCIATATQLRTAVWNLYENSLLPHSFEEAGSSLADVISSDVKNILTQLGSRPWQIEILAPLFTTHCDYQTLEP
ncbi:MAG: HRDC domain-containing protein [Corynebacterium sp.]|nr:HRDC domain-containing protein [Corynebacterium sp.]